MLYVLSVLACARNAPPPLPTPEELAASEAPVVSNADPRLGEWFTAEQVGAISSARAAFDGVDTVDAFAAALRQAEALGEQLSEPLQRRFDEGGGAMLELDWLLPSLPGLEVGYFAEGTALVVYPAQAPWEAAAARTPGEADDDFLALMGQAYGNPAGVGWPSWSVRNWDYGGCSTFGTGTHIALLRMGEALYREHGAAPGELPFTPWVLRVHQPLLADIFNTESTFPYCDIQTMQPTPPAALEAEARQILAEIALEPEARARLEARLEAGFPIEPIGG